MRFILLNYNILKKFNLKICISWHIYNKNSKYHKNLFSANHN